MIIVPHNPQPASFVPAHSRRRTIEDLLNIAPSNLRQSVVVLSRNPTSAGTEHSEALTYFLLSYTTGPMGGDTGGVDVNINGVSGVLQW